MLLTAVVLLLCFLLPMLLWLLLPAMQFPRLLPKRSSSLNLHPRALRLACVMPLARLLLLHRCSLAQRAPPLCSHLPARRDLPTRTQGRVCRQTWTASSSAGRAAARARHPLCSPACKRQAEAAGQHCHIYCSRQHHATLPAATSSRLPHTVGCSYLLRSRSWACVVSTTGWRRRRRKIAAASSARASRCSLPVDRLDFFPLAWQWMERAALSAQAATKQQESGHMLVGRSMLSRLAPEAYKWDTTLVDEFNARQLLAEVDLAALRRAAEQLEGSETF